MSFIGNIVAGQAASQIGKYNQSVYSAQAAYQKRQGEIAKATYDKVTRPIFLKQQKSQYSTFLVSALNSGAEFRAGTSPYLSALEFKVNQATDVAIQDYNAEMNLIDSFNRSILTESRGTAERFKGDLTRTAEFAKAGGKMFGNYQSSGSLLG